MSFPSNIDSPDTTMNGTTLVTADDHALQHRTVGSAAIALENKIGVGVSTPASNKVLGGSGAGTSSWRAITESDLTLSANTTGNVSGSVHGFMPALPGGTVTFYRADGSFANPSPSLQSHVGSFDRDFSGTAGDVSYTGVGFTPSSIEFWYADLGGTVTGYGAVDSGKNQFSLCSAQGTGYAGGFVDASKCIYASNKISTDVRGSLNTFNADGFTLTWIRTDNGTITPSGTLKVGYRALK